MLGFQIDLVLGAVQPEADSTLSLGTIKVIDEQDLYLLGHGSSIPLTDLVRQRRQPKPHKRVAARRARPPGLH